MTGNMGSFEPTSEARTFAAQTRQVFMALVLEGFTEAQALHIIGVMMSATIHNQQHDDK